ncbi:protein YhfH [Fictibacillus sp. b24]|uniref:protein YhfH n=1 Tax=Fictibacillus sp. b24 TaxID=3055863 RepID=UPI003CD0E257
MTQFYKKSKNVIKQVLQNYICYNTMHYNQLKTKQEELKMKNYLELHRNIPDKTCTECGCVIEEQHESYLYECERCMGKHER